MLQPRQSSTARLGSIHLHFQLLSRQVVELLLAVPGPWFPSVDVTRHRGRESGGSTHFLGGMVMLNGYLCPRFRWISRRGPCAKCLAAAVGHLVDAKAWLPASQHVERSPGNWLSQRLGISKDPGGSDVFPPPPPLSLSLNINE